MSRTVIAAVVAVVIAALTAIAFFVSSGAFDKRERADADDQLHRSFQVINQLQQLQGIDVQNKAERLAAMPEILAAVHSSNASERGMQASKGFQLFNGDDKQQQSGTRPDIIALLDTHGAIIAMNDSPNIVAKQWLADNGTSVIPAVNTVLALPETDAALKRRRVIISDIWVNKDRIMKVGVAPIIDPQGKLEDRDGDNVNIVGAIVVAYAQTATLAQRDKSLLKTDVAYADIITKVVVTSFTKSGTDEDTDRAKKLAALLPTIDAAQQKNPGAPVKISLDALDYFAAVAPISRKSTKSLPESYGTDGKGKALFDARVLVLAPISDGGSTSIVKVMILLLGIGALAISALGLYLTHRRLIAQVDPIEQGVTDIINGNVDRTFRPVGDELDGLANGLNVMLARLLGRPEPGEEEFDEEGNPIVPGRVEFEEGDDQPSRTDPDLAALAQESEPDYYKRVYTEYTSARKASGNPDEVSFENFIAKLKVNEGKLKAQYQCRAVRFRVVTKDNKVSLKPVPIFA